VILIDKKYPACAVSGEDFASMAPSMTKKTHAKENF